MTKQSKQRVGRMGSGKNALYQRSDGYWETKTGLFAVTMVKSSGSNSDGLKFFNFKPSSMSETYRVEWNIGDKLQLFPADIAKLLLSRGWAVEPQQDALDWYDPKPEPTPPAPPPPPKGSDAQ